MKKYFFLITLIVFFITQSTFALLIKTKSVPPYAPTSTLENLGRKMNTTSMDTFARKDKVYNDCVSKQVKLLTKEMLKRQQDAWIERKTAYKQATNVQAREEIKMNYKQKIDENKKWYNQALRNAKAECKQLRAPALTPATTSTATSSQ